VPPEFTNALAVVEFNVSGFENSPQRLFAQCFLFRGDLKDVCFEITVGFRSRRIAAVLIVD
jgi:hypothetical protein